MNYSHMTGLLRFIHSAAVAQDRPADARIKAIAAHPFLNDFVESDAALQPNSDLIVQKLIEEVGSSSYFGDRLRGMTPPARRDFRERLLSIVREHA